MLVHLVQYLPLHVLLLLLLVVVMTMMYLYPRRLFDYCQYHLSQNLHCDGSGMLLLQQSWDQVAFQTMYNLLRILSPVHSKRSLVNNYTVYQLYTVICLSYRPLPEAVSCPGRAL